LFISDLHLSEGWDSKTGKFSRNEDFFYDTEFAQFLVYHVNLSKQADPRDPYDKPWKLFINGDILDFLQVTSLPPDDHPLFAKYGIELTDNKRDYGLGTSEPETVWKIKKIVDGHPVFFKALGWFLAHDGNELVLLKGNHDIEIFWPKVQAAFRHLIDEQYRLWRTEMTQGYAPDTPLMYDETMPPILEGLQERIVFPSWFYHEPELFYVEHGNQYDPANAYRNFITPTIPDKPDMVELPSGSFLVRYFFNKMEQLHPFADNLRPLGRYVNWALNYELVDTLKMVLRNPRTIIKFLSNFLGKRRKQAVLEVKTAVPKEPVEQTDFTLDQKRVDELHAIREKFLAVGQRKSNRATLSTIFGFVLRLLTYGLFVWAIRLFVHEDYLWLAGCLFVSFLSYFTSIYLSSRINQVDSYISLPDVAEAIRTALNRFEDGQTTAVQFHIFGHDHDPNMVELTEEGNALNFRQWYINTGSWLPSFSETDRLTRGDFQLTFLRLVPGMPDFAHLLPELLEWRSDTERPRPIRRLESRL
jgi:UDP-2,3-diacylglucosamine pyrophosphatase LpxH